MRLDGVEPMDGFCGGCPRAVSVSYPLPHNSRAKPTDAARKAGVGIHHFLNLINGVQNRRVVATAKPAPDLLERNADKFASEINRDLPGKNHPSMPRGGKHDLPGQSELGRNRALDISGDDLVEGFNLDRISSADRDFLLAFDPFGEQIPFVLWGNIDGIGYDRQDRLETNYRISKFAWSELLSSLPAQCYTFFWKHLQIWVVMN
jgi:hypothetical protein